MSLDDTGFEIDDDRAEIENRMRNLIWTISGDYSLNDAADIASFRISKYIAMYDAVWRGAFSKYFDRELLNMYIAQMLYLGADEKKLLDCVQLCAEASGFSRISFERLGIEYIRQMAYDDILEHSFSRLSSTLLGQIKLAVIRFSLTGENTGQKKLTDAAALINSASEASDTKQVIEITHRLYKTADPSFGFSLSEVTDVTVEELAEDGSWQDYLNDEIFGSQEPGNESTPSDVISKMASLDEEEKKKRDGRTGKLLLDEAMLAKIDKYITINFGSSYLSSYEQNKINQQLCRDIHAGCRLHFTHGVLKDNGPDNYQRKYTQRQYDKNKMIYYDNHRIVRRNVAVLTDILKKEIIIHNQQDKRISDTGAIVPGRLWRAGRADTSRLFAQTSPSNDFEFVVDILIDGSGSQSSRQGKVAVQSYIISEALSALSIPHRVMSFCTFWDYTVMRLFRDYDDPRSKNSEILGFTASANNRDGLAVRAALYGLYERKEKNKILIVLSDGRPNDINIGKSNTADTVPYFGDAAVRDTAAEIRRARANSVSVLGVFAGAEEDLAAEKTIFGKDFAYIRDIGSFSHLVGSYLKKQIDNI